LDSILIRPADALEGKEPHRARIESHRRKGLSVGQSGRRFRTVRPRLRSEGRLSSRTSGETRGAEGYGPAARASRARVVSPPSWWEARRSSSAAVRRGARGTVS